MADQLTFARLSEVNGSRCAGWHPGFPDKEPPESEWSVMEWLAAAAGEVGEAVGAAKKLHRIDCGLPGNRGHASREELTAHLGDELADAVIYLDLVATKAGVDLGAAIVRKFDRVSERQGLPERLGDASSALPSTPVESDARDLLAAAQHPRVRDCLQPRPMTRHSLARCGTCPGCVLDAAVAAHGDDTEGE